MSAGSPAVRHPVWLVGAGPGDPELLTLKAVRVIGQADVLLVDDLVDRRVLAHARPGARIVEVGKRAGCPSTPQAFIERLLVHEALSGHRVVRLKGGDPCLFGRAGEEIEAARAAGLEVEVVPGITAALGAAADLGLSLTDRRLSQGVVFVTGHARPGGEDPDWAALARSRLTLVVYMGTQRAGVIARELLAGGLPPTTPVAIVRGATLESGLHHATTLGVLPRVHDALARAGGSPLPGVLIIGEAARLPRAEAMPAGATMPAWHAA